MSSKLLSVYNSDVNPVSNCNMRNMLSRCCWRLFCLPRCAEGFNFARKSFSRRRTAEARKRRKKRVDFVKQKRAKWEPTRNSSTCSRHFTQDDYIRRFCFVDEVTNKAFMPRLTHYETGITAVPSVHAEAVTKTLVVTESAKHCLERAIRMRESLSNFRTS